ncbi:MAG: hypothetical protein QXK07_06230 [Desulfurococcaceae archaeon]
MRIAVMVIALFILVIVAYMVDMILTAGKLIENVLEATGIPAKRVQGSPEDISIQVISVAILVLSIAIVFHIVNSIRKRRGL